MVSVGERLRGFRESRGLSQRDAAKEAGITQHSWSMFETDKRLPRVAAALSLARLTKGTRFEIRLEDIARAEKRLAEVRVAEARR